MWKCLEYVQFDPWMTDCSINFNHHAHDELYIYTFSSILWPVEYECASLTVLCFFILVGAVNGFWFLINLCGNSIWTTRADVRNCCASDTKSKELLRNLWEIEFYFQCLSGGLFFQFKSLKNRLFLKRESIFHRLYHESNGCIQTTQIDWYDQRCFPDWKSFRDNCLLAPSKQNFTKRKKKRFLIDFIYLFKYYPQKQLKKKRRYL